MGLKRKPHIFMVGCIAAAAKNCCPSVKTTHVSYQSCTRLITQLTFYLWNNKQSPHSQILSDDCKALVRGCRRGCCQILKHGCQFYKKGSKNENKKHVFKP